jgi:hypothetical protein
MRHEVTIGVRAETVAVVTHAMRETTGWAYEPHESSYLGEYDLFRAPEKVMVKLNFVDEEGEWDFPTHQHFAVLIVVGETERPEFFHQLATKLGLEAEVIRDKPW